MNNWIVILAVALVLVLNFTIWWLFPLILRSKRHVPETTIRRLFLQLVKFIVSLSSIIALLSFLGIRVYDFLQIELIRFNDQFIITGFVVVFGVIVLILLLFLNSILNKIIKHLRKKNVLPKGIVNVVRRWTTLVILLIIISPVLKFTHFTFPIFSIVLFTIQDIEITIGKIIQAFLAVYTVHAALIVIEYFFTVRINRKGIDSGKGHTVFQIVKYFIWVIALVLILSNLGLSVNVLLAGSAALFVGLGFGLQSLFNDFVSGLIILFEGTIKVNDIVELENGIIGRVQEIGLRTSKLLTRDNIVTIIPNNNFVGKNVINWSYNEHKTRFKVNVGVSYGSDVRLVEKVLIECASDHPKVYAEPKPFVYFNDFGESSLDFSLFFWIDDSFWVEKVRSDLRFSINQKFKENNIEIPFPQRDLHIRSGFVQQ
jgi:small-conductance mechanosensitive channel